ncbi:tetratricopeptide ankyrin repeat and coiled-coil containing 1 [Phlyctema vagabunda]|uniref:Tetratricopeptide ankyrin repeat and coiled-coil containing 1 n=1 Tax=Phlyctema vagabunda TaxID=108571 RepID=A0ABR4P7L1_9HELO
MEPRYVSSNSLEHRRAQNRMAQRRFRQKQNQQRMTGAVIAASQAQTDASPNTEIDNQTRSLQSPDEPRDLVPDDSIVSSPKPVLIPPPSSLSTSATTVKPSPHGFGVDCLRGRNNGLLGAQSHVDMNDSSVSTLQSDSNSSTPPSAALTPWNRPEAVYVSAAQSRGAEPESTDRLPSNPKTKKILETERDGSRGQSRDRGGLPEGDFDIAAGGSLSDESLMSTNLSNTSSVRTRHGKETYDETAPGAGWLPPLHLAAQKGHERIVQVLLQHGADCNEADSAGLTPLMHATIGGYEEVITLLLARGARADRADRKGRSALHWAVMHRGEAALKILLEHPKENQGLVDAYNRNGRTALHAAIETGFEPGVQLLLQYGASVNCRVRMTLEVEE